MSYHLYVGGETQECNEWININRDATELIINTTINRTCFQCLDNRADVPDRWELRNGELGINIRLSNNDGPTEGFEVVNGTLVLLNPMAVITEGKTNTPLEVICIVNSMFLRAQIFSSGNLNTMIKRLYIIISTIYVGSLHPTCN